MRKSTLFISAVLSTFALVMLYGVVSSYRNNQNISVAQAAAQPTETLAPEPTSTDVPAPTQSIITPEQAAQIASQVVQNDKLLSAESSSFNGVNAYLITFTNKDVVYVGLDGQVLSVQIAPVLVNVVPPVKKNRNNQSNGSQSNNSSGEGEHEDGHD